MCHCGIFGGSPPWLQKPQPGGYESLPFPFWKERSGHLASQEASDQVDLSSFLLEGEGARFRKPLSLEVWQQWDQKNQRGPLSSQEFSQKVLFLYTHFWLTLEPQENHKLERHSSSRLLSNNWNYHCHSTAEWKREPEEPFHSLAQQISNGPYGAQGTALASGGDTVSTCTRMFTLHEGNITWC